MGRTYIGLFLLACFIGLCPSFIYAEDITEKKAQQSMDIMSYRMAISGFEQVILKEPNRKNIRTKMAFCHFRLEENDRAIELLNEELIHFPDDPEALILLGFVHYQQENVEEALKVYHRYIPVFEELLKKKRKSVGKEYGLTKENEKVLSVKLQQENPNYGLPYFILGLEQKKNGAYDRAKNYFEQAVRAGYDPVSCYCQLIDIELEQNNWTQALVRARRAQQAAGTEAEFYFLIGYAYDGYGRIKYAISSLKKSIELKPYLVEAIKDLGIVHYNQGQFDEAKLLLERVLKLVPYDFETKFLLERVEKRHSIKKEGQKPGLSKTIIEEIKPEFKHRIESDLDFVLDVMNRSAVSFVRLGELNSAIGLIKRFLEVNDHWPGLDYNLALVYNMKGEMLNALKYAWIAVSIKKNFRDAHDLLGNIYFKLGEYDHAIRAYKNVVSIHKTDAMGYYNLGCTYAAIGDDAKAEENWKRAIHFEVIKGQKGQDEISEDELSASLIVVGRRVVFHSRMSLGQLYVNQKKWDKALEQFQLALDLDADRSEPHYELGKIYLEKEDVVRAKTYFEKYLYLGGEKEKEVQDLLDKIKGVEKINQKG
ncbi:MAG: tetratricopeptide repeat protein [Candidatus Aminicenantes bacterium]|nr:tetratricopeptide repeat protein [Candidatus Aminicenantes bacterium]